MNCKLVSIILPVYNGAKYLSESIDSIVSQSYKNWELLIIDDCSTDSSPEIATLYANKDPRIKFFKNEKNLRLPRNLNKGFSLSKGDYLTWTSDDNKYKPDAIKTMVQSLEDRPDVDFVFASCEVIDLNGVQYDYISVKKDSPHFIVGGNVVGACFLYTRRVYETIGDYDPEYTLVEDFDYWQRICIKFKAYGIEEVLYEYRTHSNSLTNTMNRKEYYVALEKMLLKNRPGFGNLDYRQKYDYYRNLYNCNKNLGNSDNPYRINYYFYSFLFFLFVRIPNKLNRIF